MKTRLAEAFLRVTVLAVLSATCRILFRLSIEGMRRVPSAGPVLLVANHQGYFDPLFLQLGVVARPIRFLMTSDFYDVGWMQPFFRTVGAIRVPSAGLSRDALRKALDVLDAGGVVGLFPEGRLSLTGEIGEIQPGVAFLAAKSGAPVVPALIRGSYRVFAKGRGGPRQAAVRIAFGRPLHFTDPRDPAAAARLRDAWARL